MESTSKEAVWQGLGSRVQAILALEQQLLTLEEEKQRLRKEIAGGKRLIVQTSRCKWAELVHEFGLPANGATLADTDGKAATRLKSSVKKTLEKTVRQWVLEAIANYVDHNPQSRVDESSIRIYIDSKVPGFLDRFHPGTVYTTLYDLRETLCVNVTQGREGHRRKTQYTITTKGRAEWLFNSSRTDFKEHSS